MHGHLESDSPAGTGAWLYVAELVHRVTNEYAVAISALRVAAAQAPVAEARSALLDTTRRLSGFAAAHSLLRPPVVPGQVDLTDYLVKLCGTMALAHFEDRPITLSVRTAHPIMLDAFQCWRAGLVVSELIMNAARHAFTADGRHGEITVSVALDRGQIVCGVHDTGAGAVIFAPGLGTALVKSLAQALDGHVIWRSDAYGTFVELAFSPEPVGQHSPAGIGKRGDRAPAMPTRVGAFAASPAASGL